MRKFGLIGFPLTHSFSKKYFEEKFKHEQITGNAYELFPLTSITQLPALIESNPDLKGLNVTIPYKESVLPYLDAVDETAAKIGAVNCIKISGEELKGYNTDAYGFETSLKSFLTLTLKQAFILGTGGSSKAVRFILKKMNIPFVEVSRQKTDGKISYEEIESRMKKSNLFINTTPLGMYPKIEEAPSIPYPKLGTQDFLFDLIYNPEETLFLKKGKGQKAQTKNGLEMLQLQAEKSWEIWNS